jgi:hypothetical protein
MACARDLSVGHEAPALRVRARKPTMRRRDSRRSLWRGPGAPDHERPARGSAASASRRVHRTVLHLPAANAPLNDVGPCSGSPGAINLGGERQIPVPESEHVVGSEQSGRLLWRLSVTQAPGQGSHNRKRNLRLRFEQLQDLRPGDGQH